MKLQKKKKLRAKKKNNSFLNAQNFIRQDLARSYGTSTK